MKLLFTIMMLKQLELRKNLLKHLLVNVYSLQKYLLIIFMKKFVFKFQNFKVKKKFFPLYLNSK